MNGVKVATFKTEPGSGSTRLQIDKLPAGIYILEYRRLNERQLITLVKQ